MSESADAPLHVTFICSGNICRSPMAEKMFAHQLSERGLAGAVRVTSAGTGGWHAGEPADRRASHVLRAHGYPSTHRAAQVDDDHLSADLVIALGRNHLRILTYMGVDADRVRMLRSFDPRSGAHALDVEDLTLAIVVERIAIVLGVREEEGGVHRRRRRRKMEACEK